MSDGSVWVLDATGGVDELATRIAERWRGAAPALAALAAAAPPGR
jgi:hypothetical protein